MNEKYLRDMKLHQNYGINNNTTVMRVVGGCIYIIQSDHNATSVFVPFNRHLLDIDLLNSK